MAENKTQPTNVAVNDFINEIDHERKREEAHIIQKMMEEVSGTKGQMWGPSIIGYGNYHYKYDSGREGDFMRMGFSPRKAKHSLYLMSGYNNHQDLMAKLGKFKTGKSCLYINKLEDIDLDVLKALMAASWNKMKEMFPED